MNTDFYTKVILTVIDLALIGNLLKPVLTPSAVQAGSGDKFEHLQAISPTQFFDTKTGDVWGYEYKGGVDLPLSWQYRLVELGKPLQKIKGP